MDDYISRDAAMRDFSRRNHGSQVWTPERVISLIQGVPTANVEPVVQACWENVPGSPGVYRCSSCKAEFEEDSYARYRGKWIGCPACRAKMTFKEEM